MSARSSLGWVVLEAGLVVLGLVGAMFAQDWQEKRRAQAEADDARAAIRGELHENRRLIVESLETNLATSSALRGLLDSPPSEADIVDAFSDGFVSIAETVSAAWEAARAKGSVTEFANDELRAFGEAYERIESYRETGREIGSLIYRGIYEGGLPGVRERWRGLAPLTGTLIYQECGVLQALGTLLGTLDNERVVQLCDAVRPRDSATMG